MTVPGKGRPRSNSDFQRSSFSPFLGGIRPKPLVPGPPERIINSYRRGLPPWDRTFDAVYHKCVPSQTATTPEARFSDSLSWFFEDHGREKPCLGYENLPDNVRLRICQSLLQPILDGKPLCLNKSSFNRDCWRGSDFQTPADVFSALRPYFEVSFSFYADALVTFLLEVPLHATFSPYVGPRVSPLATNWLNKYGVYAQKIILEIDLTRLGCGPSSDAVSLLPGVEHMEALIHNFVESQLRLCTRQPMESLVLLCRRFFGQRCQSPSTKSTTGRSSDTSNYSRLSQFSEPISFIDMRTPSPGSERPLSTSPVRQPYFYPEEAIIDSMPDDECIDTVLLSEVDEKIPTSPYILIQGSDYCPDSYLTICNHLLRLGGHVDSLRMCGFGETYTNRFIEGLFSCEQADLDECAYRVSPSTIWPRFDGQKSYVDFGEGYFALDDHSVESVGKLDPGLEAWEGCAQLPPPVIDSDGNASLPPIVGALQRMRYPTLDPNTDLPPVVQEQETEATKVGIERKHTLKLFNMYNKGKGKTKRSLSREAATSL